MLRQDITVVNRYSNRGKVTEYSTNLKAHYQDTQKVQLSTTEHFTSVQGYVQIRDLKDYVPENEWVELEDKTQKWTMQNGDYIEYKGKSRTVESFEDVDYGLVLPRHIGVNLK